MLAVLGDVRQAFHGLCISTGMQVLQAMQEADRDALCGPKGRHQPDRTAWRGGSVESHVTLGGRQVGLPRLRVRDADGEVPLASFQWAAATDALESHTREAITAGVTTRQYARTLDPVPAEVSERATSRSAVSRRFVALSTQQLRAFVSRPLGELDLRVVCIDGKVFKEHCIVIALGIDTQGRKHVLGLREGATETAAVSKALLNDLVTRGLPTERAMLFLVDGSTALRRAISDIYGSLGVVHRCQVHKYRNVLGHLPARMHASVGRALRTAWDLHSEATAKRALERLAGSLEDQHPGAAASIREGLDETLDGAATGPDGAAAADAAHDEHHREPQRWGGALHAQREALARRSDDPALGGECATGGGTALPAGSRLPRHAPSRRCPRCVGTTRGRRRTGRVM